MAPFKALSACYTVFMMNLQSWILFSGRLVLLFKHFHTGVDCVLSLIVMKEGPHGKPGMFEKYHTMTVFFPIKCFGKVKSSPS